MLYLTIYFNIGTNYGELKIDRDTWNIERILNAPKRFTFESVAFVLRSDTPNTKFQKTF